MKKIMGKSILLLTGCLLLLSSFAIPAFAWPPPCPNPCEYWNGYECYCHEACCEDEDCDGFFECLSCNEDCYCEDDDSKCDYICCNGSCCSEGQNCCNNSCCSYVCCNNVCCSESQNCCNNSCCSYVCCNNVCCSEGQNCCNNSCCSYVCCNNVCCSAGQNCCGGSCCSNECCNNVCCSSGQTCCNDEICCNSGDTCCTDFGSYCCESNETCCEGTCCAPGWKCCSGGYCCEDDKICCNGSCCDPDLCEECVDGQCKDRCDPDNCEECDGEGSCVDIGCDCDIEGPWHNMFIGSETDECNNTLTLTDTSGSLCYYYNGLKVGNCPYQYGVTSNSILYWETINGKRFYQTYHKSMDRHNDGSENDEGTKHKYDSVKWMYDCISDSGTPTKTGMEHPTVMGGDDGTGSDFEELSCPPI